MRITGWHVDGYGRFHDRGWADLPPGLTVVHGPNEAGKSTLLSFLRSMLFGLKGQNQRDPAIRPLQGGEHGGRLWLADAQDRGWTVQRHRPGGLRLQGPDGAEHDEAMLTALIGNVGRDVFEAVFAFSLTELERLDGLEGDALRGQLFAATLTGGGSSAYAALDALQARIDALYRARKSSPLKTVDERLKELRQERTRAIAEAARHAELLADERRSTLAHEELRDHAAGLRSERDRLDRLGRLWSQLDPLRAARDERDALPDGPAVADDAVERANGAAERRAILAGSIAAVEERLRLRETAPAPEPDGRLLAVADEVEDRAGQIAAQRDRVSALPELRAAARRATEAADDAVADLGPDWTAEGVAAVDASHPARQAVRVLADEAARVDGERERAVRALREAQGRVEAAEVRVAEARTAAEGRGAEEGLGAVEEQASASAPDAAAPVDDALAAIPDLRAAFGDRANRRRALRAEVEALERLRSGAPRPGVASAATDGVRVSILLLVGVLAAVAGAVLAAVGQPLGGAVVVVVGVVVVVVDRIDRGSGGDGGAADLARRDSGAHEARVREQEARVEAERRDLAEADDRLSDAAARAGLDVSILQDASTTEPIERHAAALETRRDELRTAEQAAHALADALADVTQLRRDRDETASAHQRVVVEVDRIVGAWSARREALGLPATVEPADAPGLLEAVRRATVARREAEAASARLAQADAACLRWTVAVEDLVRRARGGARAATTPDHGPTIDVLVLLRTDVREAVALDAARRERARDAERDAVELRELERRVAVADGELDALLAEHGVVDVDALRSARDATRRRVALDGRIAEAEAAVRREAGGGAAGDALIAEARTGAVAAWGDRRTAIAAELPRVEDDYRHAVAAATEAAAARRALEDAVDLPRIDAEIEQTRTDAARLMGEYRTLLRAKELIETTLDAFVRDQQPAVLRDASGWFARITEGRYTEVRQALTDGGRGGRSATLRVVLASGEVVDPAVLSRGTREQLYLCLRLALARGSAGRTGALPLVMDDVLVNFSPDRARAVADVVAAVAREQQVLFFTCHPATRDLLIDAAGGDGAGVRVEELER